MFVIKGITKVKRAVARKSWVLVVVQSWGNHQVSIVKGQSKRKGCNSVLGCVCLHMSNSVLPVHCIEWEKYCCILIIYTKLFCFQKKFIQQWQWLIHDSWWRVRKYVILKKKTRENRFSLIKNDETQKNWLLPKSCSSESCWDYLPLPACGRCTYSSMTREFCC